MKIRRIIAICSVMLLCVVQNVYAGVLEARLSEESIKIGDAVTLSVAVKDENIRGMQFSIKYDSEAFECTGAEKSEYCNKALIAELDITNPGEINSIIAYLDGQNIDGDIATFNLLAKNSSGDKTITLENIIISSDENTVEDDITLELSVKKNSSSSSGSSGSSRPSGGSLGGYSPNSGNSASGNLPESTPDEKTEEKTDEKTEEKSDAENEITLTDIANHWAEKDIIEMVLKGIVKGFEDNTFLPDKAVTRAEFCTMVSKVLGLEEVCENSFTDFTDEWYSEYVLKCTNAGLVSGFDGKFRPNDLITREEMAVIIYKAEQFVTKTESEMSTNDIVFNDVGDISEWAVDAVLHIADAGIVKGMGDGMFNPKQNTTRAQAVVVLKNFMQLYLA